MQLKFFFLKNSIHSKQLLFDFMLDYAIKWMHKFKEK